MRRILVITLVFCMVWVAAASSKASVVLQWDVQSIGTAGTYSTDISLWNGQVAWSGKVDGIQQVCFWDGVSAEQITSCGVNPGLDLYDGVIVYSTNGEIYLWDGENHIQITDNDMNDTEPSIWGDEIVWTRVSGDAANADIWYLNTESGVESRITDNDYFDGTPQVSGGIIAWSIWDGSQSDIGWWDGGSDTRITNDSEEDWLCSNYMGNVVYNRLVDGQYDLFLWDGTETIQLTDTPDLDESYPVIFRDFVAFYAYDGHDSEIYLWHDGEVFQVTDNDFNDLFPDLWVSDDYIQIAWEGDGTQVIYAVCDNPFTVPEPSTLIVALSGLLLFRLRSRPRAR